MSVETRSACRQYQSNGKARRNTRLFTTNRDISILNFAAVVIHVPNETPWVIGGCLILSYRGLDMPNIALSTIKMNENFTLSV